MLPSLLDKFTETKQTRDILQVVVSDFHSGSNYALMVNREWRGKHTSHVPSTQQRHIRERFETFCSEVAAMRKGKRIRLIHNGDAIDGDHHNSGDVCSILPLEQADIHIELMAEFQKKIDWQAGDELYYTRGTHIHVTEYENYIGKELNAVMCGDFYSWDFLQLESNGALSWFVHHGPSAGAGPNEGNQARNWLRNIYFDALKDGRRIPDIIYTGHVHVPTYSTYIYRKQMNFGVLHGIITPSWQMKTTYAWMKAPVSKNKIGGVVQEIKADGTISVPRFSIMESD